MRLRLIEERDLDRVRELRNRNRRWFFDAGEIDSEQQRAWFAALARKPVAFYVIEEDDHVAGTISITESDEGREVGNLILDERYRGRGLMREAVRQLTSEPGRYVAEVMPENEASLAVFREAGFVEHSVRLGKTVER